MKILELISSAGFYGAEAVVVNLAEQLRLQGHECIVGVFRNRHCPNVAVAEKAAEREIPAEIFPCAGRLDFQLIAQLRRFAEEHQIEIVHTHGYKSSLYAWLAYRNCGVKLVATCHNWPGTSLKMRAYALLDKLLLRKFDRVIAVSSKVRESLQRWAISPDRIDLIPNGVAVAPTPPTKAVQEGDRPLHLGMIGRLSHEKGPDILIRALARAVKQLGGAHLVIAGDGPMRGELTALANNLGLSESITFLGFQKDVSKLYRTLDVVVLPSRNEGMPMVLLEAMAAAKALIATDVGEVARVVKTGITGVVVPPNDVAALSEAIVWLAQNRDLREQIGRNSWDYALRSLSVEGMAARYLEHFGAILGSASDRRLSPALQPQKSV